MVGMAVREYDLPQLTGVPADRRIAAASRGAEPGRLVSIRVRPSRSTLR